VPLKSSDRGKSRIDVDPVLRRRIALAMATDTIAAASTAPGVGVVLVVAEDTQDAERLAEIRGVRIQLTSTTGLNLAIRDGLSGLGADAVGPVAVLPGDLPSLTADELGDALAAALAHRNAVVADRQGTGTTLLTTTASGRLRPHYGPDSLRRHVMGGAVLLNLPVESGLRRDVDQVSDLAGVTGPRTLAVLDAADWGAGLCGARPTG
jgi:2-phospho-L-lactate guanylyltransferase